MNANFTFQLTSSGHEWQFHIATDSSGHKWQFHIATDMWWSQMAISHWY